MSIFGKIKTAIFGPNGGPFGDHYLGGGKPAAPATPAPSQPQAHPAPQPGAAPQQPQSQQPIAAQQQPVDVEAVLTRIAAGKGQPSNWRTSIVDLMKLLDLDSSLDNRKELATELGYTGAKDGSAEMNIWLHKAVMRELAKNGGTVPASLQD